MNILMTRFTALFFAFLALFPVAVRADSDLQQENCGISGVILFPKERSEEELEFIKILTKKFFIYTCKRGKDASGIVIFNKDKKTHLLKMAENGPDFVQLSEFEDHLNNITNDTTIVINHNRAAAVGAAGDNNNNHPVVSDTIYLVHNGVVNNYEALYKKYSFKRKGIVDTEVIAHMINHYSKDGITVESIQKACAELSGTMALAFADSRDPYKLHLLRNENPMTYVKVPGLKLLLFNSEMQLIYLAWAAALEDFYELNSGSSLPDVTFMDKTEMVSNNGVIVDVKTGNIVEYDPFELVKVPEERIVLMPEQGRMVCNVMVPMLSGQVFGLVIPETIGCRENAYLLNIPEEKKLDIRWAHDKINGIVNTTVRKEGTVGYSLKITTHDDYVDVQTTIKNLSDNTWHNVFTFNCFSPPGAPDFKDPNTERTYISVKGSPKLLSETKRTINEKRPTLGVYLGEGGSENGLIQGFRATSSERTDDSWILTRSKSGEYYMAAVSVNASFLFNNTQLSCIHSCPDFGDLEPGESSTTVNRYYMAKGSIEDFIMRYGSDVNELKAREWRPGSRE